MKSEQEIAKENVSGHQAICNSISLCKCNEHLASCQRNIEELEGDKLFLNSSPESELSGHTKKCLVRENTNRLNDNKQAIKIYSEEGIK